MCSRSRGALRPRCARSFAHERRGRRECRVHAAPAVSCARSTWKCAHEHTGSAETLRHSLRNGFTAYAVLSSATNSSCHRRCRLDDGSIRLGRLRHRQLDTSNGCQDHTVLPYASAPFVLRAALAHGKPPCKHNSRATLPRPPLPVPTFVTMANAPLLGTGWRESSVDLPDGLSGKFSLTGLDRILK